MNKYLLATIIGISFQFAQAQNVGIGTSTPTSPLEISNPTNLPTTLLIQSGNTQYANGIVVNPSTHATSRRSALWLDNWGVLQDASGDGTKDFGIYQGSAGAWRLFINTTGNVGIGNTIPSYKLDVSGDTRATGDMLSGSHFISTSGDPYFRTNTNDKHIVLSGGSGWAASGATMVLRGVDANYNPHGIEFYTGGSERLRILTDGNVGIGTTAPARTLEVNNTMKFTNGSSDPNDGVIGTATFAVGLNIVGINTDAAGRKISFWGSLKQQENPSGNNFIGSNTFTKNNPAINNASYTQTTMELITSDNSFPGIGFHRAGTDAFALYYAGGYPPNIRYRDAAGNDARIVTNRTNNFYQQNATSNGVFDQAMINVNSGFCFLTYQAGEYRGGGEACQIYSNRTNWVLRAQKGSGGGIYCGANCISY